MAVTISLPQTISKKRAGLDVWMERALDKASSIEPEWDADEVHDLRVALRRCRTMAEALSEVSASSGWRKLKKASRGLFHTLGDLRDTQVQRGWVKKLGSAGDPVRKHVLRLLAGEEKKQRGACRAGARFIRSQGMEKARAQAAGQGRIFPSGQRRISAAGPGEAQRSRRALPAGAQEAQRGSLAPAADRPEGIPLHRREFSAASATRSGPPT